MGNLDGFDANQHEPTGTFEPLPAGDYEVVIVDSEMRDTKDGHGRYLKLQLEIVAGEYRGRRLFTNLNLVNQNEKAVEIARGTLSAICRAVGVLTPKDSSDLHMKPLMASVRRRVREDTGEIQNEVRGFKPRKQISGRDLPPEPLPTKVVGGRRVADTGEEIPF